MFIDIELSLFMTSVEPQEGRKKHQQDARVPKYALVRCDPQSGSPLCILNITEVFLIVETNEKN